jgi:hypothetical protein
LQCLIEEIRLGSFKPSECHQFEVDLRFIKDNYIDYLEKKVLDGLADQAVKSSFQNCTDKAALERIIGRF